jgi:D-glycero-D-manno-heptose 1,7-bisphosphate phosphatase
LSLALNPREVRSSMSATSPIELLFSSPFRGVRQSAVFLDRDGLINRKIDGGYVTRWDDFRFMPGLECALLSLSDSTHPIVIVSNQACVDKGLVDENTLTAITVRFVSELNIKGIRIDGTYYCPHIPSAQCGCRKPLPGMLFRAAKTWSIDLATSVLVGDSMEDVEAAVAAGCKPILFQPGIHEDTGLSDVLVAQTMEDVARRLDEHFRSMESRV